jgi:zeta-carotene desaturase
MGGIENLYLAGDYTRTDWPATMEGAVRSGYLAAEAAVQSLLHRKDRFVVADLPVQWPGRLFGLHR